MIGLARQSMQQLAALQELDFTDEAGVGVSEHDHIRTRAKIC